MTDTCLFEFVVLSIFLFIFSKGNAWLHWNKKATPTNTSDQQRWWERCNLLLNECICVYVVSKFFKSVWKKTRKTKISRRQRVFVYVCALSASTVYALQVHAYHTVFIRPFFMCISYACIDDRFNKCFIHWAHVRCYSFRLFAVSFFFFWYSLSFLVYSCFSSRSLARLLVHLVSHGLWLFFVFFFILPWSRCDSIRTDWHGVWSSRKGVAW